MKTILRYELENYLKNTIFLKQLGITRIGIFGSVARNEEANDIDLLIEETINNYDLLLDFRAELEEKFGKKVDLVLLRYANPII